MRVCFDLDETLCTGKPYELAKPLLKNIQAVNRLKDDGHVIIVHTARGMNTYSGDAKKASENLKDLTIKQLEEWNLKYDELIFGKPSADIYIDDKGCNIYRLTKEEAKADRLIFKLESYLDV